MVIASAGGTFSSVHTTRHTLLDRCPVAERRDSTRPSIPPPDLQATTCWCLHLRDVIEFHRGRRMPDAYSPGTATKGRPVDLALRDRVIVVTGATSGLGLAVAETLVDEGARVVVAARTAADVDEVAARLGADAAIGVSADLTDPTAPARLIAAARDRWGRLDGAFISHGGPPASSPLDLDDDLLERSLDLAAAGPIRLLRDLARDVEAGASLVVLTSVSSVEPIAGIAGSNVARPAVWAYAKALADEVGPRGIRVNAILPGRFATQRLTQLWGQRAEANGTDVATEQAADEAGIPLRRIGDPAELGALAAFVLSPRSGYLHGTAIRMDGGSVRGL